MEKQLLITVMVMLLLFLLWHYRLQVKQFLGDAVKQIELRNYLAGKERRKLAALKNNNNMLVDHSDDGILKDAYRCLSQASISRKQGKITIIIPTKNYPELQEYIQSKLSQHFISWLDGNYPGHHWTKPNKQKKLFGWEFVITEK